MNEHLLSGEQKKLWKTGRCKHRHRYCEHPQCFVNDVLKKVKVGYLDIESGGLAANFDYMLTYCIKTRDEEEYHEGVITREEILAGEFDKEMLKKLIDDIQKYDVIITYYGTRFDIPFIRTRALSFRLKFPEFGTIQHKDVYYMVKNRLRLHRSSLESACAIFGIKGKNHIKGNFWMMAKTGDEVALKYVADHNRKDCIILEMLHKKIELYTKMTTRSI